METQETIKRNLEREKRSEVLKNIARVAGEAIRNAIPTDGVIEKEGRANIVTAADLASEKIIMDAIRANFPSDAILSEETTSTIEDPLQTERLWVIDPIDGTSNFRHERNYSAISIGYIENGEMIMGAVYDPFRDELFYAEKGGGAFVNGNKISVSEQRELSKASVATDNSYDPEGTRRNLEKVLKISPSPWVLMKGSAVLTMCEVAAGRIDVYFHSSLKPWDNAGAFLIAKEAGAEVVDLSGQDTNFLTENAVVGNKQLVTQFVQLVGDKSHKDT